MSEPTPLEIDYRYQIAQLTKERDELRDLADKANSVGWGTAFTLQIERIQRERDQLAAEKARLEECCRKEFSDAQKWSDECQKLVAKCAEMREKIHEAFAAAWTNDDVEDGNYYVPTVIMLDLKQLAQSDQCGAGWFKKCPKCGYENH